MVELEAQPSFYHIFQVKVSHSPHPVLYKSDRTNQQSPSIFSAFIKFSLRAVDAIAVFPQNI